MSDPEILGLPANQPKQWGETIKRLAERVLMPEEDRRSALPRLSAFLTGGKDKYFSSLSLWVREGSFDTPKKQLTEEHWLNIVRYFWRRPGGLTCQAEVEALIRCGGTHLVEATKRKHADFERLFATPWEENDEFDAQQAYILPDPRYNPSTAILPRSEMDEILSMIADHWYQDHPIVLHGPPGIGKTTLLGQLVASRQPVMEIGDKKLSVVEYFHGGVRYLPLNQDLPFPLILRELARQAGLYVPQELPEESALLYQVRDRLRDRSCVLLLDGVPDAETARRLMVVDLSQSLVIIATNHLDVAHSLATDEMVISLTGLTNEETQRLYEKTLHRKASAQDQQHLQALINALEGNPAALAAAFRVAAEYGLSDTLRLVQQAGNEPLMGLLGEIFKPRLLAYQRLRSDIYRLRLSALAHLEPPLTSFHEQTVAAIFDVEPAVAHYILEELRRETQLLRPSSINDAWQIEPLARQLANGNTAQPPAGWQSRALRTEYMQQTLENRRKEVHDLPEWESIVTYLHDRQTRGQSLLWKIWQLLVNPDLVPNALSASDLLRDLPDDEYLHAQHLIDLERRDRRQTSWLLRLNLITVSLLAVNYMFVRLAIQPKIVFQTALTWISYVTIVFGLVSIIWLWKTLYGPDKLDLQWVSWRQRRKVVKTGRNPENV